MKVEQYFPIQGMTCGNCARHVEQALKNISGISKVEVNLEKQGALVEFDSTLLNEVAMAATLKDMGYTMGKPMA